MIIALALSASLDVTYEVDVLHLGDITRPVAVTRVAGGKALNVARAASALGADVHAVAALGGATGDGVSAMLAADGFRLIEDPASRRYSALREPPNLPCFSTTRIDWTEDARGRIREIQAARHSCA